MAEESPPSSATSFKRPRRSLRAPACSGTSLTVPTRRGCVMNKCSDSARPSARNIRYFSYRCLLQTPRRPQDAWYPRETPAERESGSDDEGASRKMQAIAAERLTAMSPTAPPSHAVAEEHSATQDADVTNETKFRLVLSKSQKRRQ
ncbi:hypothetical protein MTO96_046615 [Rhipicephalus appendiculatus]